MILHVIARFFLFIFCKLFFNYNACGRQNIPKTGGVIVAPNHASYMDPIFTGVGSRRLLNYIGRENLFSNFLIGRILRIVGAFPIKRNFQDLGAIREAIKRLKSGKPVLIFPEATRTHDGNLQSVKGGISFLAHSAVVPVVPVYIKGSFNVWPRGAKTIKFSPVAVFFGKPLYFEEFLKQAQYTKASEAYQPFAERIMENIARLKNEN
ncbi:MAG: 1-acyl-sn-glycerol-3-phosphate acyltransferase [Candidatus Omnitrophica bacterium CG12_big_fil_rev_8_21_14_0_65_43_15]|uniref:1-acyl-sn-glycerol-3-phosphate acyltransferase n=1 Tax=Candidatus Taenaricola geysiri TaxID=1974752 RepID=A0A2J0LF92_9BACT|nr:MAG: 1-acyl-sn-glycerol-3-phosphate acyltransferase [Candidatus Omnitrophica bacterium CG10_big_fil_rev_8_21_14_0_10_43_8]PIW66511.1 MAG: 1-acyl-sn-glycerol-3-phosphate acyltransferase [Candidatus Omnitrophica bacterium CG12_big_fil_rev_8_21_14_0_65_43_15]PIW79977.1 MAG: 1-acyl-sn-glycerol-3-phosphate acyltransferase [Candidatus Omnitrophica bacterium CG_4_8_14_3_um_filter_43_15]PIY83914.1 MAG: 1-acyl-sn-glycerol-3-phosphate acyltransferase [Candidatus Omnitrophica bacterium CG_4_10_14_0_8_um